MVRPYRKDGFRQRRRVHVRMDETIVEALDDLAGSLSLSRAYVCDLILCIAVTEGGEWLTKAIHRRVANSMAKRLSQWGG